MVEYISLRPQDPHAATCGSAKRIADPGVPSLDDLACDEQHRLPSTLDDLHGRKMFRAWLRRGRTTVVPVHTARTRARSSHRRIGGKRAAKSSDSDGEPPSVTVRLDVDRDAAIEMFEHLGELAAEMYLDGEIEIGGVL